LLFALSMQKENSTIHINKPFESKSYVNLTLQAMSDFGVFANYIDDNTIEIVGGQSYKSCDYTVEGDFSQLAFYAVLGAINNDIQCSGVKHNTLQGDKAIINILKQSGINIDETKDGYIFHKSEIKSSCIDLSDCPDLGPILTILALFSDKTTQIINAGRLRLKESDRIKCVEDELKKFGANIITTEDKIIIDGKNSYKSTQELFAHNDHRIAMSLAILGTCCTKKIVINNAESVNKSYPNFFEDLKKIGIKLDIITSY
ncbi:MAG: 3-phosphoshikimate 1-carboxyvinyltransferase, partial [Oscillospiraceae bacterium]